MRLRATLLTLLVLAITLGFVAPSAARAQEQDKAEAVLHQAIANQGGAERLRAVGDVRLELKYKATGTTEGDSIEGELTELYRGPDKLVTVLRSKVKPDLYKVYDGKVGRFMRRNVTDPDAEKAYDMDAKDLAQMREALSRARLLILTNLFVEGAKLELLGRSMGRVKLRWTCPGEPVMTLELDRFQLTRAYFGVDKASSATFGEIREFDGVMLPTEIKVVEPGDKGEQRFEIKVQRVEFARDRKFDDRVFADPKRVAEFLER